VNMKTAEFVCKAQQYLMRARKCNCSNFRVYKIGAMSPLTMIKVANQINQKY
jgi:hypothetical protein